MNINLKGYIDDLIIRREKEALKLYDPVRKKFYTFQPEELVRQLLLHYFIHEKKISTGLIQVEKQVVVNDIKKRFDIVIYNRQVKPYLLVECKAPEINLTQAVVDQVAIYNHTLQAPYLLISNGDKSMLFSQDHNSRSMVPIEDFPHPER